MASRRAAILRQPHNAYPDPRRLLRGPRIGSFSLRMASYLKHFYLALPDGFALKGFGDRDTLKVRGFATMQMENRRLYILLPMVIHL